MKKFVAAMIVMSISVMGLGTVLGQDVPTVYSPTAYDNYVTEEVNEPDRINGLNARGQNNGLDTVPQTWTRILDSVYTPWVPGAYMGGPIRSYEAATGMDNERAEIILPGHSMAWAWYGFWNDSNGDGYLNPRNTCNADIGGCTPAENNEYSRDALGERSGPIPPQDVEFGGEMVAYIEPGMHTDIFSNARPGSNTPDFRYSHLAEDEGGPGQYNAPFITVWYDGTLFQKITWKTVMNATLSPNEHGDPFTCETSANCMLDIDEYGAVVDGPVAALYHATLGPIVNSLPPVNFAITNTPTPPDEVVAALEPVNYFFAPFPGEYDDPESSAGALGYDAYLEDYQGWMDFTSRYIVSTPAVSSYYESYAFGGAKGNEASSIPGLWGGVLYTGVWKDLSEDGIIGIYKNNKWPDNENPGSEDNRYHWGWNMDPNDYNDDTGEWFGYFPPDCDTTLDPTKLAQITLTPAGGSWGNVPVLVTDPFMNDPSVWYVPEGPVITGTASCNESDLALGLWFVDFGVYFPVGNEVDFEIKVDPIEIRYKKGAITVIDTVWDKDTIKKFEPANKAS